MAKTNKRFQKPPLSAQLSILRSTIGSTEYLAEKLLHDSWAEPELSDEYFRDSLIALTHITTRVINGIKKIEDKLKEEGAD